MSRLGTLFGGKNKIPRTRIVHIIDGDGCPVCKSPDKDNKKCWFPDATLYVCKKCGNYYCREYFED